MMIWEGSTLKKRVKYHSRLVTKPSGSRGEVMDAAVAAVAVLEYSKLDRTVPSSGEPPITIT